MTRINLVPVEELSDQHLLTEYRELPRLAAFARKTVKSPSDIPKNFTLNTGHMTFFLNKADFLEARHKELVEELLKRGFNLTTKSQFFMERRFSQITWSPNEAEINVSRRRIEEKLAMKPWFYTWRNQ